MKMTLKMAVFGLIFLVSSSAAARSYPGDPESSVHIITSQEINEAKKAEVRVLDYLFNERANLIRRFNRIEDRFVKKGTRIYVPNTDSYEPLPARFTQGDSLEKLVLVVLDRQFLAIYEHGRRIASYPVVTGRKGHRTPLGRYTITKKDADHVSGKYPEPNGGSPMPWALRFKGYAYWIHAGNMTGWPSSHGCVRLFRKDAKVLFAWAEIDTMVIIVKSLDEL